MYGELAVHAATGTAILTTRSQVTCYPASATADGRGAEPVTDLSDAGAAVQKLATPPFNDDGDVLEFSSMLLEGDLLYLGLYHASGRGAVVSLRFVSSSDTPSGLRWTRETMLAERSLAAVVYSTESNARRLHLLSVPAWLLNLAAHKPADAREDETAPHPTAFVPCALTLLVKSEDSKGNVLTVHAAMKLTPLGSALRFFGSKTLSGDCAPGGKGAHIRACAYWPSSGELLAVADGSGDAGESFVIGARLLRPMLE